jgi:tetratricopeptide (TPR) repeat protein
MKKIDYMGVINYLKEHVKGVVISGIVIIVLLIAVAVIVSYHPAPPPGTQLKYMRAVSMYTMGDSTAVDSFLSLVEVAPSTPEGKRSLYYLGLASLKKGDLEAAENYFKRFLKSGLKDPYMISLTYNHLATIAINKGDMDKGLAYLKKAMDENSYSSYKGFFLYRMIKIYEEQGNYKKAYDLAQEFEKKYKDHPLYVDVSREIKFLKGALAAQG